MIRVVADDLASVRADAIVRPANVRLAAATPPAAQLDRAGGPAFAGAMTLKKDLPPGAAVVTAGGDLPAEFVIHTVVASEAGDVTHTAVARAWLSALERAQEWRFEHVAAPPVAPASAELTLADLADTMMAILHGHRTAGGFPASLSFVVASEDERAVFAAALHRYSQDDVL